MELPLTCCGGFRHAVVRSCHRGQWKPLQQHSRRFLATPTESSGTTSQEFRAAPPIQFRDDANQFAFRGADRSHWNGRNNSGLLARVRVVPASPSYFTATPQYTDDLIRVSAVWRRHLALPMLPPGEAPRVAWKTLEEYKTETAEPVRVKAYNVLVSILRRLNHIHPAILPTEVIETLAKFKRNVQPHMDQKKPILVNQWGVARAVGRRKSSHAQVYLVEGEGECLINGRNIAEYFKRVHDRESALWALKATERTDKYNVWVVVQGGGTTGQAEAVTLGVAKALLAHEPALKPSLRRAGVLTRDPRRVERKKPGHVKARKMPTWVKR